MCFSPLTAPNATDLQSLFRIAFCRHSSYFAFPSSCAESRRIDLPTPSYPEWPWGLDRFLRIWPFFYRLRGLFILGLHHMMYCAIHICIVSDIPGLHISGQILSEISTLLIQVRRLLLGSFRHHPSAVLFSRLSHF